MATGTITTTHHRVLMTDVDLVQVNFTRMFRWMDHGFTQLLHDLEHPSSRLLREGWSTPVVDAHCNYRRPVTVDDEFHLVTQVIETGRSSFTPSRAPGTGCGSRTSRPYWRGERLTRKESE